MASKLRHRLREELILQIPQSLTGLGHKLVKLPGRSQGLDPVRWQYPAFTDQRRITPHLRTTVTESKTETIDKETTEADQCSDTLFRISFRYLLFLVLHRYPGTRRACRLKLLVVWGMDGRLSILAERLNQMVTYLLS